MKYAAVFSFLLMIGAYVIFEQIIDIKVSVPTQKFTIAPGSSNTIDIDDYFTGYIEKHDLIIRSGPTLDITKEKNKYHFDVPKKLRGYRIELELSAKNKLAHKSLIIEINTHFIGNISSVALSNSASCLKDNFGIFCWGGNSSGESRNYPTYFTKDAMLYGKGNHFCGYENKRLICWGSISADIKLRDASVISVGDGGVCYVDANKLHCINDGSGYQIARDIPFDIDNITSLAVGGSHACLMDKSHKVYCWGGNHSGQYTLRN